MFEEGCAPRRKLHVLGAFARRAGQPSLSLSRFSFKLTAACVVRMASAARVKLPSSAMRMKAWTALSRGGVRSFLGIIANINFHSIPK